ncbi:unnamed protein product [Effrenium voratum]|nr:unnamed protein product [Effrenium voratum]
MVEEDSPDQKWGLPPSKPAMVHAMPAVEEEEEEEMSLRPLFEERLGQPSSELLQLDLGPGLRFRLAQRPDAFSQGPLRSLARSAAASPTEQVRGLGCLARTCRRLGGRFTAKRGIRAAYFVAGAAVCEAWRGSGVGRGRDGVGGTGGRAAALLQLAC